MNRPDRSVPPPATSFRPFSPPPLDRPAAIAGVERRDVRRPFAPLVAALLVLDAGERRVPKGRGGLATLTGAALEGGTTRRDAGALAGAFERIGSLPLVSTGWDATTISLTVTPDRLPAALGLMGEMVRDSVFPEEEVERLRERRLATLRERKTHPGARADDLLPSLLYHPDALYSRSSGGDADSVAALDSEALRAFAAERYAARRATLVLVGDHDPESASEAVAAAFDGWGAEGTDSLREPESGGGADEDGGVDRALSLARTIHLLHRPGAVQSELRIAQVGVPRNIPDHAALRVFNVILGGAFTSRLNLNLRERNGFTYGVRSSFAQRTAAGPFTIATAVGTDQTVPALREALAETEALLADGPTIPEVEGARDYLAGIVPLSYETGRSVAAKVAEFVVHGLPEGDWGEEREAFRAVTPEEVLAVGRGVLDPRNFTVVIVGDADRIESPLRDLGVGEVLRVEAE